ncbi:GlsB/YeaQ/YmgE family stress response membrane protein [Corynebacterium flavescens]
MGLGLGFFGSIVVGLIAGWLAGKIMKRDQGLVTNLIVGVIGGIIGGGLLGFLNGSTGNSWILMIVTATIGACILLWLVGLVKGRAKQ